MNWYSQLTQLILSFYREDHAQFEMLRPLRKCKVSRRWGTLKIDCESYETARTLIYGIDLLRDPVNQLRLAQQIKIIVNGKLVEAFPVGSSRLNA
jgi:hypothetical protein